jgi:hypothetical protein
MHIAAPMSAPRDEIRMNHHRASGRCLRMVLPENRYALFRITL